ncbi:hypothetical protein LBMAG09_12960 [Actinomycetes bacterium]|nr:hypothetical protein LBMAG09_12960 [Actinomycetes bacterium]
MVLDIAIGALAFIIFVLGYRAGFISSLLALVGYVGGGLLGLELAIKFTHGWDSVPKVIGVCALSILIVGMLGQNLLRVIGKGIHKKLFFGPLRWVDSILGGGLAVIRLGIGLYILAAVVMALPNNSLQKPITDSWSYAHIEPFAPKILSDVISKVKEIIPNASLRTSQN